MLFFISVPKDGVGSFVYTLLKVELVCIVAEMGSLFFLFLPRGAVVCFVDTLPKGGLVSFLVFCLPPCGVLLFFLPKGGAFCIFLPLLSLSLTLPKGGV